MMDTNISSKQPPLVATVKEVAKRAGVSTATVSRVLSGAGGVREPLRLRVLEAARYLAYRPNRAARNLRVRFSRTVGVLIPDIQNPFYTSVLCGIAEALRETDYSLLFANYDESPELEKRSLETFRAEGVRGLIFAPSRAPSSLYAELGHAGIALVAVSRVPSHLRVDQVTVANREGAHSATSHLIGLGYERIALINGPLALSSARDQQAGYEDALHEAGLPLDESLIMHGEFRHATGYSAMQHLLDMASPPRALFAASNLLTLGALQAIHERAVDIPSQIAVVGFDLLPLAISLQPPLTMVAPPAFEVGRTAADLLLDRVQKPHIPCRQVMLETQLIIRSSCGSESAKQNAVA